MMSRSLCARRIAMAGKRATKLILDENDELPLLVTATVEGTRVREWDAW